LHNETGLQRDAEAALREQRGMALQKLVYYGHSLGGAVAVWLAAQHPRTR